MRARKLPLHCCWLLLTLVVTQASQAQLYSYDGNRWYEVELAVFRQVAGVLNVGEQPVPAEGLRYLPNLRELSPVFASYLIDFSLLSPPLIDTATAVETGTVVNPAQVPLAALVPLAPLVVGPEFSPAVPRSFKVADLTRDAFIALEAKDWQFARDLQRLQESPDYDVLWHAAWRQPMQGATQTPAIYINGGDQFGLHHQLEGSVRFSDSGGRVQLDLALWLSSFAAGAAPEDNPWSVPEAPFPASMSDAAPAEATAGALSTLEPFTGVQPETVSQDWYVDSSWQLNARRDVQSDEYYYFDNPALGVLVQVRSYELPEKIAPTGEDDF